MRRLALLRLVRAALWAVLLVCLCGGCGLVVSFDGYRPAQFRVRATVEGLEGDARASLSLNGAGVVDLLGNGGVVEFDARLDDGAPIVVAARAPGHRCDDVAASVRGADARVVVPCFSEDATLAALRVARGTFIATLSPPLSPDATAYIADLPLIGPSGATVLFSARSPRARILIDGVPVTSGVATPARFGGDPARLEVKVIAASGAERKYALELRSTSTYVKASNTAAEAAFGIALAISGDTMRWAQAGRAATPPA